MAKAKPHEPPFAVVTWRDAHSNFDSMSVADARQAHKPTIMLTAGWLLIEDDGGVSISPEFCPSDSTYRGITYIPREIIVHVTKHSLTKLRTPRKETANEPGNLPEVSTLAGTE